MKRFDIINKLIKDNDYKAYLEIGTQGFLCMNNIECKLKVGVDPAPVGKPEESTANKFYKMTSDDFFNNIDLYYSYDIIFVDGLHHHKQVIKDIHNALSWLKKDGTIVVHDCNPLTEISQRVPYEHTSTWNGDVWRAWIHFRTREDLSMHVINHDEGCGIMTWGKQNPIDVNYKTVTFEQLDANRKQWLNIVENDSL